MSWWSTIFGQGAKGVAVITDSIGNILDESITNKEELATAQAKLNKTIIENSKAFLDARKSVLVTELSGSWLQRSWRPLVMLSFALVVLYQYFIAELIGLPTVKNIDPRFWDLLEYGILGYGGVRTVEKISGNIIAYKKNKRKIKD